MPFKDILGNMIPQYVKLSKTEAKILNTLITIKSGNAYGLWKASGLKHYPTVLRTVKKLEEKRLAQVVNENGTRGERIYSPTLVGELVLNIFNRDAKKIVTMVAENSSLFRELQKIEKDDDWAFYAIQDIILDVYRKEKPRGIDEAIKSRVEEGIIDCVINIDEEEMEWILKFSKVRWIRERAIREITSERTRLRQLMHGLEELAKKLEHLWWLEQYEQYSEEEEKA